MKWGILGSLDTDIQPVRNNMHITAETAILGTTFYEGVVCGQEIVLACCGVGKVNAAVRTAVAIQTFGADCILNIGIAGAMQPDLHMLDTVISSEVGFHDQDSVMLDYYPHRAFFPADAALAALCDRACAALPAPIGRIVHGRIVSGDQFVGETGQKAQIAARCSPACVEMEAAAIGQAAYSFDKPFLAVCTISDTADDDADATYDDFFAEAARRSADIVLQMLALSARR